MSKSSRQIKWGAILSYLSIFINILAGLLYTPWMIKQIGQSQYGLYTLANSLITMFLVDFGLSTATSRYVAKYRAENKPEEAERFLGMVYKLYLIIDAIIFAILFILFFFIDTIYANLTALELEQFKVVYIIAGSFAIINFPFVNLNGILNAYEKFIQLKLADFIYRILIVVLTVSALICGLGLYALVAVHAIVGIIVIVYKLIIIKKTIPIKVNFKFYDASLLKDISGFSIWATLSIIAQRLIINITPTILGIVADTRAIALFGVVATIEGYAYTITSAINGMFMPKIARMYADEDKKQLDDLLIKVGRFQYALNGLIIAGFAILGQLFISLWMGIEYIEAYICILLVIAPGIFFNSMQIANTALVVEKKVQLQAIVNIIIGVINVILSFVLSSQYGVIGACISICIAYIIRVVLLLFIYQKKMKLNILGFIKHCYLKMCLPIIFTLCIGLLLNQWIKLDGWWGVLLTGIIVVVIYCIGIFLFGLNKEERKLIRNKLKK